MAMTDEQIERYSRHIILKEVGAKGQKKLLKGKVLPDTWLPVHQDHRLQ